MRLETSDFEALLSRQGQAGAILVAYDVMEVDGHDVRPEPLEERRKRLAKLLSRKTKAMRDGIQFSEAITGDGAAIFRHACWMDLEGVRLKAHRLTICEWQNAGLAEVEEPKFRALRRLRVSFP